MAEAHDLVSASLAREAAFGRQGGYCLRCHGQMHPERFEAHHRRRRRSLGWCRCNVVALHPRCHTQGPLAVHDNPADAIAHGLIVPTYRDPSRVPVFVTYPWRAWVLLRCDGLVETAALDEGQFE